MNQTPMTVRGAEKLREELEYLKSDLRPKIIEAIAEARAHGDLKENAEYHAAREQQGFGNIAPLHRSRPHGHRRRAGSHAGAVRRDGEDAGGGRGL